MGLLLAPLLLLLLLGLTPLLRLLGLLLTPLLVLLGLVLLGLLLLGLVLLALLRPRLRRLRLVRLPRDVLTRLMLDRRRGAGVGRLWALLGLGVGVVLTLGLMGLHLKCPPRGVRVRHWGLLQAPFSVRNPRITGG